MEWNVYYHDPNKQEIRPLNIFNHSRFNNDVQEHLKKCKDKGEFAEKLQTELMYNFWCKSEYEILICPWCFRKREDEEIKVDIYSQVMLNWERFLDYVWNSKIHRPRKEYANWEYDPNGMDWGIGAWRCSKCRAKNDNLGNDNRFSPYEYAGSKFCPNCGLPMKPKE